jgi:hypothetical protein
MIYIRELYLPYVALTRVPPRNHGSYTTGPPLGHDDYRGALDLEMGDLHPK